MKSFDSVYDFKKTLPGKKSGFFLQPKLSVNVPNDQYEKQANEVADKIVRNENSFIPAQSMTETGIQTKPVETPLFRQPGNNVENIGNGQSLTDDIRNFYEPRLGYDLSQVKVHNGDAAAKSAQSINALAYTTGNNIVFGKEQYSPQTESGKRLLGHELTHVVQQKTQDNVPAIQRLVRTSRVNNCGVNNPYQSERRAVQLLDGAISNVQKAMSGKVTDPGNADVTAVGSALWTAFRLGNTDTVWNTRLPVILRRMEMARDYINSVVFQYECCPVGACPASTCGLTCDADDNAFMCNDNAVLLVLCPHLWTIDNNERGRTLAHEVFHLNFGFIGDWNQPDFHNAHCYAQFMLLLNGINPPPARRCH